MSVEANLRDLIKHKKQQLERIDADLQHLTARRDSIINLVVELESLLPQDDQPRCQPIPEEEGDLPNTPSWSATSSASIPKGRPIKDRPQA